MSYAKVLGATSRKDGYLEGNSYLVSWCILPERWQYLVSASTKKQFGILKKLMHRPDVDSVICATDAG